MNDWFWGGLGYDDVPKNNEPSFLAESKTVLLSFVARCLDRSIKLYNISVSFDWTIWYPLLYLIYALLTISYIITMALGVPPKYLAGVLRYKVFIEYQSDYTVVYPKRTPQCIILDQKMMPRKQMVADVEFEEIPCDGRLNVK